MIKTIIQNILIARSFEAKMKTLDKAFKRKKTVKVQITEVQIGILEYCAFLGIKDYSELRVFTNTTTEVFPSTNFMK